MTTWLPRSLLTMTVGAILAFAVTVSWPAFDVQTAGTALLAVGVFDLLLNAGLIAWSRAAQRPAPPPRPAVVDYHRAPEPTAHDERTRYYDPGEEPTEPLRRSGGRTTGR